MDNIKTSQNIYEHLADDISRDIYSNRLRYNMTGDKKYLNEIIKNISAVKTVKEWIREHKTDRKVLYGAGSWGRTILELFPEGNWEFIVDRNSSEICRVGNLCVKSLLEFMKEDCTDIYVLVSPLMGFDEIESSLVPSIKKENILCFGREWKEKEYFEDFLPHDKNECFIDAGVYDGKTTLDFVNWSNGAYEHIYMFEPSQEYYERYHKNIDSLKNCDWIKKGLWSSNDTLSFFKRPDSDISTDCNLTGIEKQYKYDSGEWIKIPVTSLDSSLEGQRVTYIKMDIEGSELEALKGAKSIIKEQHPKLAICVYHKLEDIWTLPELILGYHPDYKLYVRHYSTGILDTVLYAV